MKILVLDRELYAEELEKGFLPKRDGDAGIDLRSTQDLRIERFKHETIPLGVAVELPPGTVGWMTGRSSLTSAYGALSAEGKIDAGYRGEVHHFVQAMDRPVQVSRGDRICQLVVLQIYTPDGNDPIRAMGDGWEIVEELGPTDRGQRGFGSTGRD